MLIVLSLASLVGVFGLVLLFPAFFAGMAYQAPEEFTRLIRARLQGTAAASIFEEIRKERRTFGLLLICIAFVVSLVAMRSRGQ